MSSVLSHSLLRLVPLALVGSLLRPVVAQGGEHHSRPVDRRFTFVEETLHGAPPGHFEMENWGTWSHGSRALDDLDRFDFKHEIEYGISEGVHAAVDIAEWHVTDERGDWVTKFDAVGGELKFRFTDPRTDSLGVAFKTELGVGSRELEWENVLIVDKIVGRWDVAYNLVLEVEAEGERSFSFREAELIGAQALGVSYEATPALFFGGELVHELPKEWSWGERQNFFVGPNVAVRGDEWALTATAMFLADGVAEAPSFQLRFLLEFDF